MTLVGTAVSAASKGAAITSGIAKLFVVKTKCTDAERMLNGYKLEVEAFATLVEQLLPERKQIRSVIEKDFSKIPGLCRDLGNIVSSAKDIYPNVRSLTPVLNSIREECQDVPNSAKLGTKVSKGSMANVVRVAGGVFVTRSVVIDIRTIVETGADLRNRKLHEHAKQLNDIINNLDR